MRFALLLSSSRQPYRRGGFKIGPKHTPTRIELGADVQPEGLLAILSDPVVVVAHELVDDDDKVSVAKLTAAERVAFAKAMADTIAAQALTTASVEAAAIAEQLLGYNPELQPASGASGYAEGDASTSGASAASSGEAIASATSINSPGDAASSAEDAGQSRQAADEPAADRKAGEDEGKQPGETPVPPVAEPDITAQGLLAGSGDLSMERSEPVPMNTTAAQSQPAGADNAAPAAEAPAAEAPETGQPVITSGAEPAAGKPARKAKPKAATEVKDG